jgi:hypothetical protein
MPRNPDAPAQVGGQMPVLVDTARQMAAMRNQSAIAAMQDRGATERTGMQAASAERIAAMRTAAEDRQAAMKIRAQEADRNFTSAMMKMKNDHDMEILNLNRKWEKADIAELNERWDEYLAEQTNMEEARNLRLTLQGAINAKISTSIADEVQKSSAKNAEYQLKLTEMSNKAQQAGELLRNKGKEVDSLIGTYFVDASKQDIIKIANEQRDRIAKEGAIPGLPGAFQVSPGSIDLNDRSVVEATADQIIAPVLNGLGISKAVPSLSILRDKDLQDIHTGIMNKSIGPMDLATVDIALKKSIDKLDEDISTTKYPAVLNMLKGVRATLTYSRNNLRSLGNEDRPPAVRAVWETAEGHSSGTLTNYIVSDLNKQYGPDPVQWNKVLAEALDAIPLEQFDTLGTIEAQKQKQALQSFMSIMGGKADDIIIPPAEEMSLEDQKKQAMQDVKIVR